MVEGMIADKIPEVKSVVGASILWDGGTEYEVVYKDGTCFLVQVPCFVSNLSILWYNMDEDKPHEICTDINVPKFIDETIEWELKYTGKKDGICDFTNSEELSVKWLNLIADKLYKIYAEGKH